MPFRKSRPGAVALLLVSVLLAQDALWAFPHAFEAVAAPQADARLRPSADFPWVSLRLYRGPDDGRERLRPAASGPVLSMAAGDFDEDGFRDLISTVETPSGGLIRLHRGNLDAIYPHSAGARDRKLAGAYTDQPFFEPRDLAAVSFRPDLVAAGDFDGDGHFDLVVAQEGEQELHFLTGAGDGTLALDRPESLDAPITHLLAADVNRRDGLPDLIVGVSGARSQVRVYEGPHGAMRAQPEVFEIDGLLSALTVGQFDDDPDIDIAAAAGNELSLIRGRDRKLSIGRAAEAIVVDRYRFEFKIHQLVGGDFTGDHRLELAALANGGEVHLISPGDSEESPTTRLWRRPAQAGPGLAALGISSGSNQRLVPARVSTFPKDDLVLFNPTSRTMAVLVEDGRPDQSEPARSSLEVSYSINDELRAVLPMRLSPRRSR